MKLPEVHETRWVPWALAAVGLVVFVVGAVVVIVEGDGGAALALVITGAALMVIPLIIHRLESFSVGAEGFEIQLSQQIVALGAPQAAGILERSGLASFAMSYSFVHEELKETRFGPAKVHLQDRLVDKAAELSRRQKFDAAEVRKLFLSGPPMVRVLALGLMEGDPSLADAPTVFSSISRSLSGNEQYHGLQLAEMAWREMSSAERQTVVALIDSDPHIPTDKDRARLAGKIKQLPLS